MKAIEPLECVPDRLKDWHPGTNDQVLDLVHPSLFPLIYGRSKIVTNGKVGVDDALKWCGKGEVIPIPKDDELEENSSFLRRTYDRHGVFWSKQYQWLPSDVQFSDQGGVKITSYVNNLHPVHHRQLYPVLEQLIATAIPLWNESLSDLYNKDVPEHRIHCSGQEYKYPGKNESGDEEYKNYNEHPPTGTSEEWRREHRVLIKPEPKEYKQRTPKLPFDLRSQYGDNGFQVIIKLANVHLTPEKPGYEGGSWHVEGMLNEHICATALYYYSNSNITDSMLRFRQRTSAEELEYKVYEQDDFAGLEELYGIQQDGPSVREVGSVATKEGRLLTFPNVLQHCVAPFELVDKTKPGHRKILAMFLVDPFVRVISTANVPPQQRDWWAEVVTTDKGPLAKLPTELQELVVQDVEEFPISLAEAKKIRERLMEERAAFTTEVNSRCQIFWVTLRLLLLTLRRPT